MRTLPAIRGTRRALVRARGRVAALWARSRIGTGPPVVELAQVSRRLELLLAAMYGRTMAIEVADPPAEPGWFRRFVLRSPGQRGASDALPELAGDRILLPRAIDAGGGETGAIARYRVLALVQAERIVRGTAAHYPASAPPLVRDLYLLSEGVATDAAVARFAGGVRPALRAARAAALVRRPALALLTSGERAVERLVRRALGNGPPLPGSDTPAESLAWALATAKGIDVRRHYWGVRPVAHWGLVRPGPDATTQTPVVDEVAWSLRPPTLPVPGGEGEEHERRGGGRDTPSALTTGAEGRAPGPAHAEHARAPARWTRDRSEAGEGDVTGEGGARPDGGEPPAPPPEAIDDTGIDAPDAEPSLETARSRPHATPGVQYPEWDHVTGRYRERAATVRTGDAAAGEAAWAGAILREQATLVRSVRQRFERLRARRLRHRQQPDGDEIDLAACVRALVDRRMGQTPDDRLYVTVRPTRHPLAIALLVDVSGSTKGSVTDALRMIDIEKVALLLASEALSALGDRYAIFTFAGHGAEDVRVTTVKGFGEANGEPVRRRIAALEPDGFTRLGAAVRHATAVLGREPARHRLLLLLSDGRPNDVGHYMTEYGVEDSRQAMHEARAQGVYPFCLNVDREGPEYLARIFGPAGYTTLRRPDQLPRALLQAVRMLIA